MNWMDIIALAIILLTAIIGYFKGFVIAFINITGWIIAVICSIRFYPVVSQYIISHTSLYTKINQIMGEKLAAVPNMSMENINLDISSYIQLPEVLEELLVAPAASDYAGTSISEMISRLLLDVISMMIIFIVLKLALVVIGHILDKFCKFPILNQINKITGLLFGAIQGGIIVLVVLAILVPVTSIFPNDIITDGLDQSTIIKYLYNNNIILTFIDAAKNT